MSDEMPKLHISRALVELNQLIKSVLTELELSKKHEVKKKYLVNEVLLELNVANGTKGRINVVGIGGDISTDKSHKMIVKLIPKSLRTLLIGFITFLSLSSFSISTYTVIYNQTTSVTCMVGDTLEFYSPIPNGSETYAGYTNLGLAFSPTYAAANSLIKKYEVLGSETTFTIFGTSGSWTLSIIVQTPPPTGLNEYVNSSNIKLFPNPFTDVLNVTDNCIG